MGKLIQCSLPYINYSANIKHLLYPAIVLGVMDIMVNNLFCLEDIAMSRELHSTQSARER